jgi:ABC-type uncharacterized transport system permease subunit
MAQALLPAALAGYVLGIVLAAVGTIQRSDLAGRAASFAFTVTWLLHSTVILHRGWAAQALPLRTRFEFLLVLGWALLGLYLYVWFRFRVNVAALVLPPLAMLATAIALASSGADYAEVVGSSTVGSWFLFHTTISTLGMAILGVAFTMALLYLFQDRALKSRKVPGLLQRLPALDQCDQLGLQALIVGFTMLTLGIITGIIVNAADHGEWISGSAKQILPLVAWAVFAVVLLARTSMGIRGRRSAYLTIAGFVIGLASVLGMAL